MPVTGYGRDPRDGVTVTSATGPPALWRRTARAVVHSGRVLIYHSGGFPAGLTFDLFTPADHVQFLAARAGPVLLDYLCEDDAVPPEVRAVADEFRTRCYA